MINFINSGRHNNLKVLSLTFLVFIFLNLQIGCYYKNFYQVRKFDSEHDEFSKAKMDLAQKEHKYIIIHVGGAKYHLYNIVLNHEQITLKANYEPASTKHQLYIPDSDQSRRYKEKEGQAVVLNEIHIIGKNFNLSSDSTITIPLENIDRIDVIEKDRGKTTASYVLSTLGIVYGVIALVYIIILLTKSSCPFIYVEDGENYVFKGEIYGGAIFKPLERDDYLYLKTVTRNDTMVNIKISNELMERQYTDIAELIVVEHDPEDKLYIDTRGTVHSVSDVISPVEAILNESTDYLKEISFVDSSYCIFNDTGNKNNVNELTLKFPKPKDANNTNLILTAKNSLWLDYAFGEMTKLFGASYDKWIEKSRSGDKLKMLKWASEQYLPLSVFLLDNSNTWRLVEELPTSGPLASRDFCIPIDLSETTGDYFNIKLSCGFMFWELDYAALGIGSDSDYKTTRVSASGAVDHNNTNVTSYLSKVDGIYLQQPEPGNYVTISYNIPEKIINNHYSVFIYTRGYYEHIRNYTGSPDLVKLNSLKKEGSFVNFSRELFDRTSRQLNYDSFVN